jgi:c-di-GMP-binding flagellar brake protein YcgR
MENLSDFLIKAPKQVLTHLKTLAAEKCLIAVNFGENFSFLTAILDIDEKKQLITIDCGPKEYLNKKLLNSGIVNFKTELGGIKVLFEGRDIKKAGKPGQTALSIKLPEHIYWIQRRKYYRVRSPLSKNSYCSITFPETEENQENEETLHYKLYNLSATGFAILSETEELAERLTLETEFNDCQLVLDTTETHTISFIVRSKFAINPNKPQKIQRIGCELLSNSPKVESAFLRYMQEIEREIRRNQK